MNFTKNFIIYGIGTILAKASSIIFVPIFTRYFAPDIFGAYDLILSIFILIYLLSIIQFDSALSRFYYDEKKLNNEINLVNTVGSVVIFISVLISIILIIFAENISILLFNTSDYYLSIVFASLSVPFYSLHAIFSTLLRFQEKALKFVSVNMIQVFLMLFASIFLVFFNGFGIEGLFLGISLSYIASTIIFLLFFFRYFSFKIDFSLTKKLLKFSLPMLPSSIISWINNYASRLIIIAYLSLSDNGIYAASFKLCAVFLMFDTALRMTWGPFFWKNLNKKGNIQKLRDIYLVICSFTFTLLYIFIIFSPEIFKLFTPNEYWDGIILLGFLSLSNVIFSLINIVGMGPDIVKKTYLISVFNTIAFIINILILFIFIESNGLIVVPIALLITNSTLLILLWVTSEKLYYIGYSYKIFIKYFLISLVLIFIINNYDIYLFYKFLLMLSLITLIFINNRSTIFKFFKHQQ